jgi:twitching motility protein PilI
MSETEAGAAAPKAGGPFQLLLDIAARARTGPEATEAQRRIQPHWSGVGFAVSGHRFVAPLGQVTEIMTVPSLTRLPRVKPWVRGVANVRGRLLPVADLAAFFGGRLSSSPRRLRALVVEAEDIYCGLLVDEVLGLKHFGTEALREPPRELPEHFVAFVEGAYVAADGEWTLFNAGKLVGDARFLDAAL